MSTPPDLTQSEGWTASPAADEAVAARAATPGRTRRVVVATILVVLGLVALANAPRIRDAFRSDAELRRRAVHAAQIQRDGGDLAGAERSLRAILAQHPDDTDALLLLGLVEQQSGRPEAAEATFRTVVGKRPRNIVARVHLAQAALARGDADAAVDQLAGVRRDPQCPAAAHELAVHAELVRGDLEAALAARRDEAAAQRERSEPCVNAARLASFLAATTWSDAYAKLADELWTEAESRAAKEPEDTRPSVVAQARLARGKAAEALSVLPARAAGDRALVVATACARAIARAAAGETLAAEAELTDVWREPPEPRLLATRCWVLVWSGDIALARRLAEATRTGTPTEDDLVLADELRCLPDRVDSAGDLLALGLARIAPANARLDTRFRAAAERARGGISRFARFTLRLGPALQALQSGAAHPETMRWLAREMQELDLDAANTQRLRIVRAALDLAAGRAELALARLEDWPAGGDGVGEWRFVRGLAMERLGRFDTAALELSLAVGASGDDPVRIAALVRCLAQAGDVAGATERAALALAARPGDPWITAARGAAARSAADARKWRADTEALDEAARLLDGEPDAAALAAAETHVASAEASPRERRRALRLRARLCLAKGDAAGAGDRARLLLAEDPDDATAAHVLRRASPAEARERAARVAADPADVESRLRAASAFAAAGESRRAVELLEGAPDDDPRVLGARAEIHAGDGRFGDAEAALRELLARSPDHAAARLALLHVLEASGNEDEAAEGYREILADAGVAVNAGVDAATTLLASPRATEADASLVEEFAAARLSGEPARFEREVLEAYVVLVRGRYDDALVAARRLTAIAPSSAEPHVVAALALGRARDWPGMRVELGLALVASPNHPVARRLLTGADVRCGVAAYLRGDLQGAGASLERAACSGQALDAVAAMLLAQVHVRTGEADTVLACAKRLELLAPHGYVARLFRGLVERSKGSTDEAARTLGEALRAAPGHPILLCAAAQAETAAGRAAAAADLCRARLAAGPDADGFVSYLLGQALESAGDRDGAVAAFRAALDASPATPSYLGSLVRCLVAGGRVVDARAALVAAPEATARAATDTMPSYARVVGAAPDPTKALAVLANELLARESPADRLVRRGELHLLAGDAAGAEAACEQAIRLAPEAFGGPLLLVHVMWKTDRLAEARERFEKEAAARPEDPVPPTICGALAETADDPVAAERWYRRALAISPRCVVAANNLAYLLTPDAARRAEAMSLATTALAGAPFHPTVLDTHGWLLLLVGKPNAALAEIGVAARLDPDAPEIRWHEAEALAAAGRLGEARETWSIVLRLDPEFARRHPPSGRLVTALGTGR